jgi:hypothetical protein
MLDVNSIQVTKLDFLKAMKNLTPASHRSTVTHARDLTPVMRPLLGALVDKCVAVLKPIFPFVEVAKEDGSHEHHLSEGQGGGSAFSGHSSGNFLAWNGAAHQTHRPRLLIHGEPNMGQEVVSAALLVRLEELPTFCLDLPSLNFDPSAKSLEEAMVQIFAEARRKLPSVLFLPHLDSWWESATEGMRQCLMGLMDDTPPQVPILLIGTCSC